MADDDEPERVRSVLDFAAVVGFTDPAVDPLHVRQRSYSADPSNSHVQLDDEDPAVVEFFAATARGPADEPISDLVIVKPTLGEHFPPDYELLSDTHRGFAVDLNASDAQTPAFLAYKRTSTLRPVTEIRLVEVGGADDATELPDGLIPLRLTVAGHNGAVSMGAPGRTFLVCFRRAPRDPDGCAPPLQYLLAPPQAVLEALRIEAAESASSATPRSLEELLARECFGEDPPGNVASPQRPPSSPPPAYDAASASPDDGVGGDGSSDGVAISIPVPVDDEERGSPCLVLLSSPSVPLQLFAAFAPASPSRDVAYIYPRPPLVLDRYPQVDSKDQALPIALSMFCQPLGALYRRSPFGCRFLTFVLTNQMGDAVHCTSLQFFERRDALVSDASRGGRASPLYAQRSFVTLSPWPFYHSFQAALVHLHACTGDALSVPWERHLVNLFEVPAPPPRVAVRLTVTGHVVKFWQPDFDDLPVLRFPSDLVFRHLSVVNVVRLVTLVMLETKVVVHSRNECLLTPVLESVMGVIMPLKWPNVYIPVFPEQLADFLQAFVPFVLGTTTDTFRRLASADAVPDDVAVVDLDGNVVQAPRELPWLPQHQALADRLVAILGELDDEYRASFLPRETAAAAAAAAGAAAEMPATPSSLERRGSRVAAERPVRHLPQVAEHANEIREAFLSFMCRILARYADYMRAPAAMEGQRASVTALFDREAFCAKMDDTSKRFYKMLFETVIFNKLIEDRTFLSDQDGFYVYFDAQMDAILRRDDGGAQPSAPPSRSKVKRRRLAERDYAVPAVNAANIPTDATFTYRRFPTFDASAFAPPRPTRSADLIAWPSSSSSSSSAADSGALRRVASSYGGGGGAQRSSASLRGRRTSSSRRSLTSPSGGALSSLSSSAALLSSPPPPPPRLSARQAAHNATVEIKTAAYCVWFRLFAASASRAADAKRAVECGLAVLWRLKEAEGLVPDYLVYQCLLEVCGRRGLADEARFIFRDMTAAGIHGDAVAYGWHVQAIAGARDGGGGGGAQAKRPSTLFESPLGMAQVRMWAESACAACERALSEAEIMAGWEGAADDVTSRTRCPLCACRLAATIRVEWAAAAEGEAVEVQQQRARPTTPLSAAAIAALAADAQPIPRESSSSNISRSSSTTSAAAAAAADLPALFPPSSSAACNPPLWFASHVPTTVPLLAPNVLFAELSATLSLSRSIARSKAAFLRDHPLLFWNCVWLFAALAIPIDAAGLARLFDAPAARAFAQAPRRRAPAAARGGGGGGGGGFFGSFWSSSSTAAAAAAVPSAAAQPSSGLSASASVPSALSAMAAAASATAAAAAAPPSAAAAAASAALHASSRTASAVLAVNGLSRSLSGWPQRRHATAAVAQAVLSADEESALRRVEELIAGGQMFPAITAFMAARARMPQSAVFARSCYEFIVEAALRPQLLKQRRPRARSVGGGGARAEMPRAAGGAAAAAVAAAVMADGDSIDFLFAAEKAMADEQPTTAAAAARGKERPARQPILTGQPQGGAAAAAMTRMFESEMDVAEVYEAALSVMEPALKEKLTVADKPPSTMVITMRAVFPHLRL